MVDAKDLTGCRILDGFNSKLVLPVFPCPIHLCNPDILTHPSVCLSKKRRQLTNSMQVEKNDDDGGIESNLFAKTK